MSQDIDYRRVRKYVEDNINKRRNITQFVFFSVSLGMFIVFNIIVWVSFNLAQYGEQAVSAGVMLASGWGVSILYQFLNVIFNTKAAERQRRESLMLRGIQHEMARQGMAELSELEYMEKPKRRESVRLTDDGELVDATEQPARKTSASER